MVTNQAKILIVSSLGWVKSVFCVDFNKGLFHTMRPVCAGVLEWLHLVLIASVNRGIETVSAALPHITTNLPLSNLIQARLVTAEERRVPRAEALTSRRFPVMRRGSRRGTRRQQLESARWACSATDQEIDLFRGEWSVCYLTDRCVEDRETHGLHS